MKLNIEHRTCYRFNKPVGYTIQQLRLTPQDGFGQRVNHWQVKVSGRTSSQTDAFGNKAHTLVMDSLHQEIVITASGEVETDLDLPPNMDDLGLPVYLRATALTQCHADILQFAHGFMPQDRMINRTALMAMMSHARQRVQWVKGVESDPQSAIDALTTGVGSSQGMAHLFISCCRALKVPAKFVHGYCFNAISRQIESHSWADVWLIGQGWQSFDVANNARSSGIHVRLATGLDYRDACPISSVTTNACASTSLRVLINSMDHSQQ